MTLAEQGREDPEAARELRQLAGGRVRLLRRAGRRFTVGGLDQEVRVWNRAERLLDAAVANREVHPEDPRLSGTFDRVERLLAMPDEAAFEVLVDREPKLLDLRRRLEPTSAAQSGPGDASGQVDQDRRDRSFVLLKELPALLGPQRPGTDELLSMQIAFNLALVHLRERLDRHI